MRLPEKIKSIRAFTRSALALNKIKGGALYIAIIVSIVIGILLCMFILIAHFNQRNVNNLLQSVQLQHNLKSAFELAHSAYFLDEYNNHWFKNSSNNDSIKIKKNYWGAYLLICASTKNKHHGLSRAGIYGTYMSTDTGLVVADNGRPVGLSGAISFKATCYLPREGVRPAYIEGQSYQAQTSLSNYIKPSPLVIPAPENHFIAGIVRQHTSLNVYNDSVVAVLPKICFNAFTGKTLVCENMSTLSNLHLTGNIKITGREITIDSTCRLNNVLIVCSKARFGRGFKGRVHVIASDSIIAAKNCSFGFPSSLVLLAGEPQGNSLAYITFETGVRFFGSVLAVDKYRITGDRPKTFVKIGAGSEINGFVYVDGFIHIEGTLNANVYAGRLLLKTPSAVYENHLLSCEINPAKYAHVLAVAPLFKKNTKLLCCERMN